MSEKVCPFLTAGGAARNCIQAECMLWLEGNTSSTCALVKQPRKQVTRLDAISAQLQELQILVNQLVSK